MGLINKLAKSEMFICIFVENILDQEYLLTFFFLLPVRYFNMCSLINIQCIPLVRPIYSLFNDIHCLVIVCLTN